MGVLCPFHLHIRELRNRSIAERNQLYPPQANAYTTAVQQPINADGTSNFKSTGKSVIPVKFSLATAPGAVVFQSILTDPTRATITRS